MNYEDDLFDLSTDEAAEVEQDLGVSYDPETDDSMFGDEDPTETSQHDAEEENTPAERNEVKKDFITKLLRDRGIDKTSVQFANEKGEIELYDFDDLEDDEKYAILSEPQQLPISDEEINTINFLRQNNINLQEFAKYQRDQAIKEYLEQNSQPDYTVDQLSDDDLFKFDLLDRFPDLTDEEVEDELEAAKANEPIFNRKVQALRNEYKQLEDEKLQADAARQQQQSEQEFQQYAQDMVNVARSITDLHGLELEDQDKEQVLSFLLDKDVNGQSGFFKLFNDPQACFRMAWYALYGDQAFESVNNYYKSVIEQSRRAAQPAPKRAVRRAPKPTNNKSADALDMDKYFK